MNKQFFHLFLCNLDLILQNISLLISTSGDELQELVMNIDIIWCVSFKEKSGFIIPWENILIIKFKLGDGKKKQRLEIYKGKHLMWLFVVKLEKVKVEKQKKKKAEWTVAKENRNLSFEHMRCDVFERRFGAIDFAVWRFCMVWICCNVWQKKWTKVWMKIFKERKVKKSNRLVDVVFQQCCGILTRTKLGCQWQN